MNHLQSYRYLCDDRERKARKNARKSMVMGIIERYGDVATGVGFGLLGLALSYGAYCVIASV